MTIFLATWREPGQTAVETAWQAHQKGGDLRTCLEEGLAACELDPKYLAIGLGSLANADGELELDAAMMDGADLSAGAVCAVQNICPVISVARKVLEDTPHVMLAGDQAKRFAMEKGFKPQNLMTEEAVRQYDAWRAGKIGFQYIHTTDEHKHGDTVTMLGWQDGHMVSASATSGLAWKLPGRVGDSPIIGAGIYADDEAGAAGATGLGEELWKACASFRTVEGMRRGLTAQEACDDTIKQMMRRQPASLEIPCVVLAISKEGDFGAATTEGVFHLWNCVDGEVSVREVTAPGQ
ncbi:N(4)-(beta-N-acetylglucosaminyl)-L-asparaginase [Fimbriimonas ginsengisoli]|uniref:Twin-arginine translocation pathway signal n=1 Tax=Fimbriimonas ginsengisoli Gsoil 348 TaxID=661478 RepID=A0A068NKC9_FIMGI|nr:N(4)-(beta-N-acetylglucosaminyl)-L-asparaginase [Fimbriimonas ginsengisoli]AIE83902.1 Twin-arginine translocation pathway signal [Fimbriimonas ginsengisoli Gsoil 348]